MFLFSLPAGALADIVDRRRLLIVVQIAGVAVAALFAIFRMAGVDHAQLAADIYFPVGDSYGFGDAAVAGYRAAARTKGRAPSGVALTAWA